MSPRRLEARHNMLAVKSNLKSTTGIILKTNTMFIFSYFLVVCKAEDDPETYETIEVEYIDDKDLTENQTPYAVVLEHSPIEDYPQCTTKVTPSIKSKTPSNKKKSQPTIHLVDHGKNDEFIESLQTYVGTISTSRSPIVPESISPGALTFSRLLLRNIANQNPENKWITCEICDFRVIGRTRIFHHMRRYHKQTATTKSGQPKKFCCEICGTRMSLLQNLRVHMRIHSGERPFPCLYEGCDRRFSGSSERKIHMRAHSGEKPFKCEQCPMAFHNKNHFNMHLRTRHSDYRPFLCAECGQSFKISDIYKKHLLTHTDIRQYHCDICGRSFRQRSAYQVHVNIHTDNRPFKCCQCDRGFHSSAARRSHEKKFHKLD